MLARVYSHTHTHTQMHSLSPLPNPLPNQENAPEGKSGSQVAAEPALGLSVTQEVPCYLRSCPLSSDATSSM